MVENYKDKKDREQIVFQPTDDDKFEVVEKRYDEFTGEPVDKVTAIVNGKQIEDLLVDLENQIQPLLQRKQDLQDMLKDVKKIEDSKPKEEHQVGKPE